MDYKATLNLPKTDFPMKADLPKREPLSLEFWQKQAIYRLIQEKSKDKEKYILHDGPPYANGDIHIGHALNKTLKDIIVKYKTMRGYNAAYVPGWDCHGLPVEHQLFKELGINKSEIPQLEFRKKAHSYAMGFVNKQKEQFIRLGVFADWQSPYLTLSPEYEEAIISSLAQLADKGYIYRGLKPVNWCFKCETALAEAEVEYENRTSPSVFVKFRLDENRDYGENSFLVIWTTTPWTLIANAAVSVHPEFSYYYINTEKGNLIIARDLLFRVLSTCGIDNYRIIREVKGRDLEGLIYSHPFGLRKARVVLAEYVSGEEGSGLVHTAPGHGSEDYLTGLKYRLDIIMPVNAKAKFDNSVPEEFKGLDVWEANKVILEKLQGLAMLLWQGELEHSYPHCWRCKSPVIFRATEQWFLKIDHQDLRKKLLEVIEHRIKWVPCSGRERISAMIEGRPDWCLSRQRYWGVPIPSLVCNNCQKEVLEPKVIKLFAGFAAKEGSDTWFVRDITDFIPEDLSCPYCKAKDFSKGRDILDVWFDSGVSSQAVLKKRKDLKFPAQLYLEGSDQHRGWFQSSLIPAMCIDGVPPFKEVLTHGFVVDGQGRKMSKSQGNVISPFDIIKNYGGDILRLWVAAGDYNEDIRISGVILTRLSEAYRKIRNTVRFMLSNLYDFSPDRDKVHYESLRKIDRWILGMNRQVLSEVEKAYEDFAFHRAYKTIYDFCNEGLSMYYLDMVKGRLYTCSADSLERRASQTAIYELLNVLVRIMAPILVFTAEEIWQYIPKQSRDKAVSSVHLLDWPREDKGEGDNIPSELNVLIDLIPDIAGALEEKRASGLIGSSFDAKINLLTNQENRYKYLNSFKQDELCEIFKVSQVEIMPASSSTAQHNDTYSCVSYSDIAVEVLKAEGNKCQRCWNYSFSVGANKDHPLICEKCVEVIHFIMSQGLENR